MTLDDLTDLIESATPEQRQRFAEALARLSHVLQRPIVGICERHEPDHERRKLTPEEMSGNRIVVQARLRDKIGETVWIVER